MTTPEWSDEEGNQKRDDSLGFYMPSELPRVEQIIATHLRGRGPDAVILPTDVERLQQDGALGARMRLLPTSWGLFCLGDNTWSVQAMTGGGMIEVAREATPDLALARAYAMIASFRAGT
jgi:hypothetical protein